MFIGHFGLGLAAKKAVPATTLALLFLAVQFLDLLWPTLLLTGTEHVNIEPGNTKVTPLNFSHYPISHSLLMVIVWAACFGYMYWLIKKNLRAALVLAACVVSHWLLDVIVHRPDLPLYPGNTIYFGLGLWNNRLATVFIECMFFLTGVVIYLKNTSAKNKVGNIGLWVLLILLLAVQVVNMFGPPPPNVTAIAWAGQLQWLFIFLAFWVDKNRTWR